MCLHVCLTDLEIVVPSTVQDSYKLMLSILPVIHGLKSDLDFVPSSFTVTVWPGCSLLSCEVRGVLAVDDCPGWL